jgi:hypothetical protein
LVKLSIATVNALVVVSVEALRFHSGHRSISLLAFSICRRSHSKSVMVAVFSTLPKQIEDVNSAPPIIIADVSYTHADTNTIFKANVSLRVTMASMPTAGKRYAGEILDTWIMAVRSTCQMTGRADPAYFTLM